MDRVTNVEVGRRPCVLEAVKKRRPTAIGHLLRHEVLVKIILEDSVDGRNCRPRLEYVRQIMEELGCRSHAENKRLLSEPGTIEDY